MSDELKKYEVAEIERQAKRILRQNAVYVRYPELAEDGGFSGTEKGLLYIVFNVASPAIGKEQENIMWDYLLGNKPHRFNSSWSSAPLREADMRLSSAPEDMKKIREDFLEQARIPGTMFVQALSMMDSLPHPGMLVDMSGAMPRFERHCLADVGTVMEISRADMEARYRMEAKGRKEVIAYFGGREFIPTAEANGVMREDAKRHLALARFMLDGACYLDAKDRIVKEEHIDFGQYIVRDDQVLLPRPDSPMPSALRPATQIVSAAKMTNDYMHGLWDTVAEVNMGLPAEYALTRQHAPRGAHDIAG